MAKYRCPTCTMPRPVLFDFKTDLDEHMWRVHGKRASGYSGIRGG